MNKALKIDYIDYKISIKKLLEDLNFFNKIQNLKKLLYFGSRQVRCKSPGA